MKTNTTVLKLKASQSCSGKIKYIALKTQSIIRETHYVVIKVPVYEKDITILITYECNKINSTMYKIKAIGPLGEINKSTHLFIIGR